MDLGGGISSNVTRQIYHIGLKKNYFENPSAQTQNLNYEDGKGQRVFKHSFYIQMFWDFIRVYLILTTIMWRTKAGFTIIIY